MTQAQKIRQAYDNRKITLSQAQQKLMNKFWLSIYEANAYLITRNCDAHLEAKMGA
jgi:hypothetical protein